jgi:phosphoribosyl 1,2-cyclic phosphodiesterase
MALYVKFWGTRGSIPTPGYLTQRYGGNTPCVEVRTESTMIVCDAGSGLRELGMDIMRRFGNAPVTLHLLLSHTHWDHIQGFPFFPPAYLPTTTIHVYGANRADRTSYQLLTGQMESAHFPVNFTELGARMLAREFEHGEIQIGDVAASAFPQCHPGGSLGFGLVHGGRKVVYSTDNELDKSVLNAEAVAMDPAAPRRFPAEIIEPFRDADLLIADAQYSELEYPKRIGWGHSSTAAVVDIALAAGVKQLALFHHDPMQSDADLDQKIAACARRANERAGRDKLKVFGAREGVELKLV